MKRPCSQPDCDEPAYGRGLCRSDYRRAWRRQTLDAHPRFKGVHRELCTVGECGRVHYGRGWCKGHYERWRTTGDAHPEVPMGPSRGRGLSQRGQRVPRPLLKTFDLDDTGEL